LASTRRAIRPSARESDRAPSEPLTRLSRLIARHPRLFNPSFWVGVSLVAIIVLAGPFFAPHDPNRQFDNGVSLLGEPLHPSARFPLGIALTVVFEGSLAYLGLGVPPPQASWGQMIRDAADPNALI
jgi:ABC-type antimicrobial peptide transport system permease subunit